MNLLPRTMALAVYATLTCLSSAEALAQKGIPPTVVVIGGHAMSSEQDIIANLSTSSDHTVFVSLLRAAGLSDALAGHGPFTVFAPTNYAFAALPSGMLETLRRPEGKAGLVALLSMHIVPSNYSSARLRYIMRTGKGQAEIDTISDGKLIVTMNGPSNLAVRDPKGNIADIVIYDAKQANGVVFATDRVLMPG